MRAFAAAYEQFRSAGAEVLGISSDPVESHAAYARQLHLPFRLLSDADGSVRARFGVTMFLGVIPGRATFVIGRDRRVVARCTAQLRFERHALQALAAVARRL